MPLESGYFSREQAILRQQNHTTCINIICFFLMLVFGTFGGAFEMFIYRQNIFWDLASASFIPGCVLSGM